MRAIGLLLLVVGCAAAYGWQLAPAGSIAMVWNISGALYRVFLLGLIALLVPPKCWPVRYVAALLAVYDLMVAGCSLLYMIDPWPILPGDERCSTKFNFPLGLLGAVIALCLAARIFRGSHEHHRHRD